MIRHYGPVIDWRPVYHTSFPMTDGINSSSWMDEWVGGWMDGKDFALNIHPFNFLVHWKMQNAQILPLRQIVNMNGEYEFITNL